jgi:hypothetical protein
MKFYLKTFLATLALVSYQQMASAYTEVVCTSKVVLAHAGSTPSLTNPSEINDRITKLEEVGLKVTLGQPTISISTSAANANLAASMICVSLTVDKK